MTTLSSVSARWSSVSCQLAPRSSASRTGRSVGEGRDSHLSGADARSAASGGGVVSPSSGTEPSVVCFPFVGHVVGGSHISTLLLMQRLHAAGIEVRVPLLVDGPVARLLERNQLPWDHVEVPSSAWRGSLTTQLRAGSRAVPFLGRYLHTHDVDVVHTNDGRMHRLWGTAAITRRRPWIWHHRTPGLSASMGVLAGRADRVVAVSHYARDQLSAGVRRRTTVVDNPFLHVDPTAGVDVRRELRMLTGEVDRPMVGYVSNMRQSRKRPEFFLDVAAGLAERGVDVSFPMIGAVPPELSRALLQSATERGLGTALQLLGSRYPIEPWIAACDVLVVPALDEPFGRTLVEAAMLGTPVVASRDGGHPEIIDHGRTGVLFDPSDVRGAVDGVAGLLADDERRQGMGAAARAAARKRYSVDRHAEAILEVYRDVRGSRRG